MVSLHMCSETFEKREENNERKKKSNATEYRNDALVFLIFIRLLCFHLESFLSVTIWAALYFPKQSESFGLIIVYGMFRLNSIDFPRIRSKWSCFSFICTAHVFHFTCHFARLAAQMQTIGIVNRMRFFFRCSCCAKIDMKY